MVGALAMCIAVVAMAEVVRAVRFVNVVFGVWLIAAPLLLDGGVVYAFSSVSCGAALVVALSMPRSAVRERYGTLDRLVR